MAKSQTTKGSERSTIRCSLKHIVQLVEQIKPKLRDQHLEAIRRTPFKIFFNSIYDGHIKIESEKKKRNPSSLFDIVTKYSPEDEGFKLGKKKIHLLDSDVALIFGFPVYGKEIEMGTGTKFEGLRSEFKKRMFQREKKNDKLDRKLVEQKISLLLGMTEDQEYTEIYNDFARLMIIYMMATFFYANSNSSVPWSFLEQIEDFDGISEISFAKSILAWIVSALESKYQTPDKVSGCLLFVLVSVQMHNFLLF